MKRILVLAVVLGLLGASGPAKSQEKKGAQGKKSAAELEKEKALRDPYPNDLGPEKLDEAYVKTLSKDHQEGYKALLQKCAKCHASSRPLNSQFLEAPGKDEKEREAALKEWKASHPGMFKDKQIFQAEANIWSRYVKRMMAKPGCEISKDEGKKIWQFLVQDSLNRKTGKKMEAWMEQRSKMMEDFKAKHPARYKELFGGTEEKEGKEGKKGEKKG